MYVTRLEAIGFKKLKAVSLDVGLEPIQVTGDNEAGKTSVLDSIMWAFKGTGTDRPINKEATKASVSLDVGDGETEYVITRRATQKGTVLDLRRADGKPVAKAQTVLNALMGNLSFDPEAFTRLGAKKQAERMKAVAGLDLTHIENDYAEAFASRTAANRVRTDTEKVYKTQTRPDPMEKLPVPSATAIIAELQKHKDLVDKERAHQAEVVAASARVSAFEDEVALLAAKLKVAKVNLKTAQAEKATADDELKAASTAAEGGVDKIADLTEDLSAVEANAEKANEHNNALDSFNQRKQAYLDALSAWNELDEQCKLLTEKKAKRIAEADMPIEGMTIDEDGVFIEGVPFADLNTASRIKISTAIAMMENPDLKVIFVREGALLNSTNLKVITDLAAEKGYQVWIEKFQEEAGENSTIHIVDGAVADPTE